MADAIETTTTDTTTSTEATTTDTTAEATATDESTLLGSAGEEAGEGVGGDSGAGEGEGGEGGEEQPSGAPEAYEISLTDADGNPVELDADMLEQATDLFREFNLNNEQANKLVPLGYQMMQRGMEAAAQHSDAAMAEMRRQWAEQFRASEFGGAKAEETLHLAAKGLDGLGFTKGTPFRDLLDTSGLGNHPDMILTFRRLGELLGEDSTFANPSGAGETTEVGWADLYNEE